MPVEQPVESKFSMPRSVCELHSELLKLRAKLRADRKQAESYIDTVIGKIAELTWGVYSVAAESVASAIANASINVASALLGAVSGTANAAMELLVKAILEALIGSKDAIYAMAGLAKDAVADINSKEYDELKGISEKIGVLITISNKWAKRLGRPDYSGVATEVIPIIESSMGYMSEVIDELTPVNDESAYFNKAKYNSAVRKLTVAIEKLQVESGLSEAFDVTGYIDERSREYNVDMISEAKPKWSSRKREAKLDYIKSTPDNQSPATITANVKKYKATLASIDMTEKSERAVIKAKSELKAASDFVTEGVPGVALSLANEFTADVELFVKNSVLIAKSINKAALLNKSVQGGCNNIMYFEDKMYTMIDQLMELIGDLGNTAAGPVVEILETVEGSEEVAVDLLKEGVASTTSDTSSPASMVSKISGARSMLVSANALLSSSINDSLIKLINSDEELLEEKRSYNEFVGRINNIPDWDGKKGVWAKTPFKGAPSAYQHILTQISAVTMYGGAAKFEDALKELSEIRYNLGSAIQHNRIVATALNSWFSPQSDGVDALKEVLDSKALSMFAVTGSLAALVSNFPIVGNGDVFPNYSECEVEYPELYQDEDIAMESQYEKRDAPNGSSGSIYEMSRALRGIVSNKSKTEVATRKMLDEIEEEFE